MNRLFVGGEIPPRIAALPRDARGYPVPKFVKWFDGKPDFRVVDEKHLIDCIRLDRCWICGDPMGTRKAFVIGPMCCINRVSSEPPSHYGCAHFAALNCPFMARPMAKRNDRDLPPERFVAGMMIERNPGVAAIWMTRTYKPFKAGEGLLMHIGEPERIEFYAQSRRATRDEIMESVRTGFPILEREARRQGDNAMRELNVYYARFQHLLERYCDERDPHGAPQRA